jgi:hypothetical protein
MLLEKKKKLYLHLDNPLKNLINPVLNKLPAMNQNTFLFIIQFFSSELFVFIFSFVIGNN